MNSHGMPACHGLALVFVYLWDCRKLRILHCLYHYYRCCLLRGWRSRLPPPLLRQRSLCTII